MSKKVLESGQFLSFVLSDELFAVNINKVREVLDFIRITKMPNTPPAMLGVINLRGSVVPVIDMRLKFGMPSAEKTVNTCIVIMETTMGEDSLILGALVDSVQEVFDLDESQIEPPPKIGTWLKTEFIQGMGKHNEEEFTIILDVDKIFSTSEILAASELSDKEDIDEFEGLREKVMAGV